MLIQIFGTSTTHNPTNEVSEVFWAYLGNIGYAGANINIWY